MINYFIFVLLSFPEIKTEGLELHCSLWEQKEKYLTGEPVFLRISVKNNSSEKIWVFPIDILMKYTAVYMSVDGRRRVRLDMGVEVDWAFPFNNSDPESWAHFFYPLEGGDSVYQYIFINEPWEYDIPSLPHHYKIEKVRHGLNLKFFSSIENCPFSPLAGKIEKELNIEFSVVSPEDIRELELMTIIRNPKWPFVPEASWEEKVAAYKKLKKEYPNSPYLPLAMSIVEKKKFLETYPNSPLVYEIIRKVSRIGVKGLDIPPWVVKNRSEYRRDYQESFGDFDKEKCLKYFNSFLSNEKYKGTLLEDAILLWIDDVEKSDVKLWRQPSSTYRRKIK